MGGAPPSWRCVWLGPDFQSIDMGGEWGGGRFFPSSGGELCCDRQGLDGAKAARWRLSSRPGGWGFGPLRPSLFCSAPHPPGPRHPLAHPVGGRGLQARGERDPRLQPRPATRGFPPPHCPQRLGGGGGTGETGPAPPAATPQKASRAAPGSPGGSGPWRRPPPPHKGRRPGGGGLAYRDVGDALLALVRHGPPLAPSARPADPWGWLSLGPALSRPRSPWAR